MMRATSASSAFEAAVPRSQSPSQPAKITAQDKYMAKVAHLEVKETLRNVSLFKGLQDDHFETLAQQLEKLEFRRKHWVFKQGDHGDRFYVITAGEAVVVRNANGVETVLKNLTAGDFFGERSLLQEQPRFAGVRCVSKELAVLSISKEKFTATLGPLEGLVQTVDYEAPQSRSNANPTPGRSFKRRATMGAVNFAVSSMPTIRRHRGFTGKQRHQAKSLIEGGRPTNGRHATFADVCKADEQRKKLLTLAREINPIDSIAKMAALPRTVIPRIATHSLTWLVLLVYLASSTMTHAGIEFGIRDLTSFDGSNTLVTFMIIFYVGCNG